MQQIIPTINIIDYTIPSNKTRQKIKVNVFSKLGTFFHFTFLVIWLIAFVRLAQLWFLETKVYSIPEFTLITLNVFWLPVISLYFFIYSFRQKATNPDTEPLKARLAMVTTKIPSEPLSIVQHTLLSMKSQSYPYPYDVWLCDEDPNTETIDWCYENDIKISCRKGNPNYFNSTHPRKKKCKEGNLMYFYDHYGYTDYDFTIQFDADHAPEINFAREVMKEFNDPKVGYVSTPSICDINLDQSWTVKARLFWEATLHGPIQSGANDGLAPMCFGSHYSLRVKALEEIGGIGPEIAEDYTTTAMLNAYGWKGGFAGQAIAHGMGAVGIKDSMHQEYQWALVGVRASMLIIPKIYKNFTTAIKLQSLVWIFWYPALTLVTAISLFFPLYAIITKKDIMETNSSNFWQVYLFMNFAFVIYLIVLRFKNMLRPHNAWAMSWETMIFQVLQFPWIAIGVVDGFLQVLRGYNPFTAKKKIKITDKTNSERGIDFGYFLPHFVIIAINLYAVLGFETSGYNIGYKWFAFISAFSYSFACFAGSILSIKESKGKGFINLGYIQRNYSTILSSLVLFGLTCYALVNLI